MNQLYTSKSLSLINVIIILYFGFIYLINIFGVNFVLIGVVTNFLTIPFLLAEVIFLILGIRFLIENKKNVLFLYFSLVLLFISFVFTYGSFLIK